MKISIENGHEGKFDLQGSRFFFIQQYNKNNVHFLIGL